MKVKDKKRLWRLHDALNRMGGTPDMTAVSQVALVKYKEAHGKASRVISLILTGEDDDLCDRLLSELEALASWNFGDRHGRISDEEVRVNRRITEALGGWTPLQ